MSRRTQTKQASIEAWRGVAHCRIRHDVTDSPAWLVLSYSARALYVDLRAKLNSTNNGNINATLVEMKHRGWTSAATLSKALRELEAMGFIAKTRQGGIASLAKVCSLYRFTDLHSPWWQKLAINECKATFDWKHFESVNDAEAAICKLSGKKNKPKLQKLKLIDSKTEAIRPFKASKTEQVPMAKL